MAKRCNTSKVRNELTGNITQIQMYKNKVGYEIKQNLLKLRDILHKIENANMSASQGYNLCKLLQDYLRERRVLKTQLSKCFIILNIGIDEATKVDIDSMVKDVDTKQNYTPRILDDIFDD